MAYNSEVQELLINFLLSDSESFSRCQNILRVDYFDDEYQKPVEFILDYAETYHAAPTFEHLNANSRIKFEKIEHIDKVASNALLDELEKFCRHRAIENEILKAPDKLQRGEYAEVEKNIKQAVLVSLQKDLGVSFFDDPREILLNMRDGIPVVSTGWKTVDFKLFGGVAKGSLLLFAGGSGSGKSLFLQNISVNWSAMKMNVVYITLELSEDLVFHRLSGMVSGTAIKQVLKNIDDVGNKIKNRKGAMGSIQIKYMPAGTTANDLKAYINEYQVQTGKKVDAIVIDYLDLMHPNNKRVTASDLFVKDKYVSEELRSLAMEQNAVLCTASQLNRDAVDETEHTHAHIAGGISKINTADNVLSIHTTAQRREKGEYQIQFMKTRSSSGVGSKVDLDFNVDTLRITDKEQDISVNSSRDLRSQISKVTDETQKSQEPKEDDSDDVYEVKKTIKKGSSSELNDLMKKIKEKNNRIRDS